MNLKDLVIGIPYEIEIEPSIDMGDFRAELCVQGTDVNYHINLVRNEGFKHTLILPNIFEIDKSEYTYKIFLFKDNACFEVDAGTINIIKDIQNNKSKKKAPTAKITIVKKDDVKEEEDDNTEPTVVAPAPTIIPVFKPEAASPTVAPVVVETTPVPVPVVKTEKRASILKQVADTSKKKQKVNDDVKNIIKSLKH